MFTPKLSLLISLGMVLATKGYQVTTPSDVESSGPPWTSTGPNAIVWQRVSTDPDLFAIVLVNEVSPWFRNNDQGGDLLCPSN
jgi:hypothetical protein